MTYLMVIIILFLIALLFIGARKVIIYKNTQQKEKEESKEKILGLFNQNSKITNDEVQKLLNVSDATATRYLDALEKEGSIKQVGKTGKYVYYEKI